MQEVHYHTEKSEWCNAMQCVEERIEEIMSFCKEISNFQKFLLIHHEWLEIEVKWKKCRVENQLDEERTTDELIAGIADLVAGLNPIVRDARRVSENLEKEDEYED